MLNGYIFHVSSSLKLAIEAISEKQLGELEQESKKVTLETKNRVCNTQLIHFHILESLIPPILSDRTKKLFKENDFKDSQYADMQAFVDKMHLYKCLAQFEGISISDVLISEKSFCSVKNITIFALENLVWNC